MENMLWFVVLCLIFSFNTGIFPNAQANAESPSLLVKSIEVTPSVVATRRSGGSAVKCYSCYNCSDVYQYDTKTCPYSPDRNKNGKCVTFKTTYDNGKINYIRNCASIVGNCLDLARWTSDKSDRIIQECSECETDECNSQSSASAITTSLIFVMLPAFASKLLL